MQHERVQRRQILQWMGLGALAAGFAPEAMTSAWAAVHRESPYQLRFFTPGEQRLADELMERILPTDAHSPGAHAAQVSLFADFMLASGGEEQRRAWRAGLALVQQQAAASSLDAVLAAAAAQEEHPASELGHFFLQLKHMTINGYYTSSMGIHQDLQYQGNTFRTSFPGCTHPEHQG